MDLIILILLAFKNGNLAKQLGHRPSKYRILTVVYGLVSAFVVCMIGVMIIGVPNTMSKLLLLSVCNLAAEFAGYLMVKQKIENLPLEK